MTDETPKNPSPLGVEEKKKRKPLALQLTPVASASNSTDHVRQSLSHGRSKNVTVEVKRHRSHGAGGKASSGDAGSKLTAQEQDLRRKALQDALHDHGRDEQRAAHRMAAEALFAKPPAHESSHDDGGMQAGTESSLPQDTGVRQDGVAFATPLTAGEDGHSTSYSSSGASSFPSVSHADRSRDETPWRGRDGRASSSVDAGALSSQDQAESGGYRRSRVGSDSASSANGAQGKPLVRSTAGVAGSTGKGPEGGAHKPSAPSHAAGTQKKRRFKGDTGDHEDFRGKDVKKSDASKKAVKTQQALRQTSSMSDLSWVEYEDMNRPVLGLKKLRKKGMGPRKKGTFVMAGHGTIVIKERITIEDLAGALSEKVSVLHKEFQRMGIQCPADGWLDGDVAQLFAEEKGFDVKRDQQHQREEMMWHHTDGEQSPRPPVVTVMGHVDHGKTSLLDALRQTDVAAKESGGITQHIGAYQVHLPSGKVITFIDTPGHEAFTEMRSRGAATTDMVILVVAADDGINAQTVEAIRHCQAAQVPMIVAINKMDKPGARPDHVRQQLLQHEIVVEHLGGNVQDVEVSALKKMGLDRLEEAILLQAEILGLKASYETQAKGVILETRMKKGHGAAATLLVQQGTVKKGDVFVVGQTWGRVRLMFNESGAMLTQATPSQPVEIVGFSQLPASGDRLMVVRDEAEAKDFVEWKHSQMHQAEDKPQPTKTVSDILEKLKVTVKKEKSFILKVDAQGSLEGIMNELNKIVHDEVQVKIVQSGVGPVNEGDVLLAETTQSTILCFNVPTLPEARKLIESRHIPVLQHSIIYRISEDVKRLLSEMLEPVYQEEWLGKALVMQVFPVKKEATIAGCIIKEGLVRRGEYARVVRGGKTIYEGVLKSLRHLKDDVKERSTGHECGMALDNFNDLLVNDEIHCYTKKRIERHV